MKVLFVSLGCDKNRVDSERMLGLLAERGYEFTDDEAFAKAAVVNTCCFIHDAKKESIQTILALAERRKRGELRALVVSGCLAQRYQKEIREEIPEVDAVLGVAATSEIADALDEALRGHTGEYYPVPDLTPCCRGRRILTTGGHYAYLKIAEGCDKRCTYCIIPMLRGSYRSVPMEALLQEAAALAEGGVRELILVAQETTRYGVDLYGKKALAELLHRLCEIPALQWIRVMYCYPEEIDDALINAIRNEPKVCRYLDIPVQSGSDRILRRMGRHTDAAQIRALVAKLRERIPGICIRTTLISGFPGETADDHRQSMQLARELAFDRLGVFTYSAEEGTAAYDMPEQVPERLKKTRCTRLMKQQQRIIFEQNEALRGRVLDAMIEGELAEAAFEKVYETDFGTLKNASLPTPRMEEAAFEKVYETVYVARTYRDAPEVDGLLFVTGASRAYMSGDRLRVRIDAAQGYDLIGTPEETCAETDGGGYAGQ